MQKNPLSEGEEMIGDLLFEMKIKYEDQKKISNLKNDKKSFRIADFYLPKLNVYIEFFGNYENPDRNQEYKEKRRIYKENNIPCIYIWPNNLGIFNWIFKERLRAVFIEHKRNWMLFKFELGEFIKEMWLVFLILTTIGYGAKNQWIALSAGIIIVIICLIYIRYIKLKHKRIRKRHKLI